MKNLKLSLLALVSVISFGLMSQSLVYTTNTSSPNVCDGTAMLDTNINFSVINWQGMGMIIQSGGYYIDSLCPGAYTVSVVINNFPTTLNFNIIATNYGDTVFITNPGTCTTPLTTFNISAEDCTINYATVDTAYMQILGGMPDSQYDSILCVWWVIDTNSTYQTYMVYYPAIDSSGCYNFQLTVYCYNKSLNYKTLIINQPEYIGFLGVNELTMNTRKLIKVIDMMGNETKLEPNRFLIKCYDDGTTEKVFQFN